MKSSVSQVKEMMEIQSARNAENIICNDSLYSEFVAVSNKFLTSGFNSSTLIFNSFCGSLSFDVSKSFSELDGVYFDHFGKYKLLLFCLIRLKLFRSG